MSNYKEKTDEQLALLYIDGNNEAFDELLYRIKDKVFGYILSIVKDYDLANDLFQETFIKAITKLQNRQYSDTGKFLFWMTRIAHNVVIDYYRAIKSEHVVDLPREIDLQNLKVAAVIEGHREMEMVNHQVMEDVKRLMNALPDSQREVVYMRYFQQMSFKEIAEETGVSINTSLGRMRYAIINMRRLTRRYNLSLDIEL